MCVDGIGQPDVQRIVVLDEGRVLVMKHQLLKCAV